MAWQACDNPEYVEKLIRYIEEHAAVEVDKRSALDEEQNMVLTGIEVSAKAELDLFLTDVRNMYWHKALKMTVDGLWRQAWEQPSGRTCYLLWGHMAL